jgi:hypothetical protein
MAPTMTYPQWFKSRVALEVALVVAVLVAGVVIGVLVERAAQRRRLESARGSS